MPTPGPPAYAWDWLARQRLPWREAHRRLCAVDAPLAARYRAVDHRTEVVALLRADYGRDDVVRATVDAVVAELAFLGRTGVSFATLGIRTPPRGMRWWWTALTGEELDPTATSPPATPGHREAQQLQLSDLVARDPQLGLDDVAEGYGD